MKNYLFFLIFLNFLLFTSINIIGWNWRSEDVDNNGIIDIFDIMKINKQWGEIPHGYTPEDIDKDGKITINDIMLAIKSWGKTFSFDQFEIITPNGGETISGTEEISWNITAIEDTDIFIDIHYSSNNGKSWNLIKKNISNSNSFSYNFNNLPGSNDYLIKLTANCRYGSQELISSSKFTVLNEVNENFSFSTMLKPNITVKTGIYTNGIFNPIEKVRVTLWDGHPEKEGKILYSGITDNNGFLKAECAIGSYVKELYASTNFIGFEPFKNMPVNKSQIHFDFYSGNPLISVKSSVSIMAQTNLTDYLNTLGTWESTTGYPSYVFDTGTPLWEMFRKMKSSLPELSSLSVTNPEYLNPLKRNYLEITEKFPLFVTFLYEDHNDISALGYYTYPTGNPPANYSDIEATTTVIFPNASFPDYGGDTMPGTRIYLGTFSAGQTIAFFRSRNGLQSDGSVSKTFNTRFSNSALNSIDPTDLRQYFIALYDPGSNTIVLGTEITRRTNAGCDNDFNDQVYLLSTIEGFNTSEFKAYWRMEESTLNGTNGEVEDETNSYHGTSVNTPSPIANGHVDRSIRFNGTNEYITTDLVFGPNTKTINFWVKYIDRTGTQLMGCRNDQSGNGFVIGLNGNNLYAEYGTGNATVTNAITANNQWHMITMTDDQTPTNNVHIYLDGQYKTSFTGQITGSIGKFSIACRNYYQYGGFFAGWSWGIDSYCNAEYDEITIDSRSWNLDDVTRAYLFGEGIPLRNNYKFPVLDYSSETTLDFTNSSNFIMSNSNQLEFIDGSKMKAALNSTSDFDVSYLLSYWKCEESSWNGTANEIKDETPNNNNCTATGGANTFNDGKIGRCATSDGIGDYINTGINISDSNVLTYSTWMRMANREEYNNRFMYSGVIENNRHFYIGFESVFTQFLWWNRTYDKTDLAFGYGNRTQRIDITGTIGNPQNDVWYMLTMTYNESNGRIYIYVNDTEVYNDTASFSGTGTNPFTLLGYYNGGFNSSFIRQDEIILDDQYWDSDKVTYMYNSGNGRTLVRYPEPPNYPYITTNSSSQLDFNRISSITVNGTNPSGTDTRFLISPDNKSTWYYWDYTTNTWKTCALTGNNLMGFGMTINQMNDLVPTALDAVPVGTNTLDFACGYSTSNPANTPYMYNIKVYESSFFSTLGSAPPFNTPFFDGHPYSYWDREGRVFIRETPPVSADATFLTDANDTFTEDVVLDTFLFGQKVDLDIKTNNTYMYLTFATDNDSLKNSLGYYTYPTGSPPTTKSALNGKIKAVFPNCSLSGSGGTLNLNDTVKVGPFNSGTSIGFFIAIDGWNSETWFPENKGTHWYSQASLNSSEGISVRQHFITFNYPTKNCFVLATETNPRGAGSDGESNDFNDLLFMVSFNQAYSNVCTDYDTNYPLFPKEIPTGLTDADGDTIPDTSDDYPLDPTKAFDIFGPAFDSYGTLGFDDGWPYKGDEDFNEMIIDYYFHEIANADNEIVEINAKFRIKSYSGGMWAQHGFGIQFDGLTPDLIASSTNSHTVPTEFDPPGYFILRKIFIPEHLTFNPNGTEAGQSKAVFIIFGSHRDDGLYPNENKRFNASNVSEYTPPPIITLNIVFTNPVTRSQLGYPPYNPFLIKNSCSENRRYRYGRSWEIHLKDHRPTDKAKTDFWLPGGTDPDVGDGINTFYRQADGKPYAINTALTFDYPKELINIGEAHTYYSNWAESEGSSYPDWYIEVNPAYRDSEKIYSHPSYDNSTPEPF